MTAELSLPEGGAEWLERRRRDDRASQGQVQAMTGWLETLATKSHAVPVDGHLLAYPRATDKARTAFLLLGADAFVIYAVEPGHVRILFIGNTAPEGFVIPLP